MVLVSPSVSQTCGLTSDFKSCQPLDQEVPTTVPEVPTHTVFDVLVVQHTHFLAIKPDPKTGDIHQQKWLYHTYVIKSLVCKKQSWVILKL